MNRSSAPNRGNNNGNKGGFRYFINNQITRYLVNNPQMKSLDVICIDSEEKNHGSMPLKDALSLAQTCGLDLVMISVPKNGNPPICKILDFGKFKFEQDKKDKALKKKQRENAVKIKEIKFRPNTGENDLQVKAKQMQEFIDDGNRLKVTVVFKGREMAHKDIGIDTLKKFAGFFPESEFDAEPLMTGRMLTAVLIKRQ